MRAVILIPIGVVYLLLGGPDQSHSGIFYYVTKYEYFYCRLWNYRDWITVVTAWRLMTKHSVLRKNNSWIHNNKNAKKGKNGKRGSRKSLLMILIWQNGIKSRKTDLILIWVINATGLLPRSSFKTFCWRHESYFFKFLF